MLQRFIQFFKDQNLLQGHPVFLAAVSGGIDSVVLCELCHQAGLSFSIAHCNFGLRGEESERDEHFVRQLALKYSVPIFVERFNTIEFAETNHLSIQESARALRYQWFASLQDEHNFAFTLVAHHADDNIETLLMNFFRGTGLQGLTAMPVWNKIHSYILRPMLQFRRKEISSFAEMYQLKWVEDSSNSSSKYTRNFFRNELIPALSKIYPSVEENLIGNIDRFKKVNAFYQSTVEKVKDELFQRNGMEIRIPVKKLEKYRHTSFIYEMIHGFGFGERQVEELKKLLDAPSGKFIENDSYQIIKHRNWLVIAPRAVPTGMIAIDKGQDLIRFGNGTLEFSVSKKAKIKIEKSEEIAQMDARNIEYPLILRKWKQGDYFYPLGMNKKKKLARFFIDQKLSKNQKEDTWVIESSKRIIWVVGLRIDDRFKITDSTREVITLRYLNSLID